MRYSDSPECPRRASAARGSAGSAPPVRGFDAVRWQYGGADRWRACLLAPLLATAVPALGETGEAPAVQIEEVIVTARKKSEPLQDAPIAITAFSAGDLEAKGISTVTGINGFVPNLQAIPSPSSSANVGMSIRGLSSGDPSFASDPKVGLYLDGVYIAKNSGAIFDVIDIEAIEVLRGPQGTLWGKNTTGGAINIATRKPGGELYLRQELSVGNFGYWKTRTSLDLPQSHGVSASLNFLRSRDDGFFDNVSRAPGVAENLGTRDITAWSARVLWQPADELVIDYAFDSQHQDGVPKPMQLLTVNPDAAVVPSLVPGVGNPYGEAVEVADGRHRRSTFDLDFQREEDVDISGHRLSVDVPTAVGVLRAITAYREYSAEHRGHDGDGGGYSVPIYHSVFDKAHKQLSQELQLLGDGGDGRFDYTLGLFYFDDEASESNPQFIAITSDIDGDGRVDGVLPLSALGVVVPLDYAIDSTSKAIYGQLYYTPPVVEDRLTISVGVRYTEDEKSATLGNSTINPPVSSTRDWSKLTSSLSLVFQASEQVSLYGKYAHGYNAGVFNIRASTAEAFAQPADEENIHSFELGAKTEWFGRRLRLNGALFWNSYEDLQVSQFRAGATGASSIIVNAGEADAKGVEVELLVLPVHWLRVNLTYGYIDMEYAEYRDGQ
ncbi:TonB-dependent receptor [Parahaliea mediterranea]|uniref:TonB-dependent receptor n=1 Tax=Parahaliea mediterranea TaxID=651086 RepID=A0A939IKM4_9GAMM|nr:TonB-dependent receptor [Parahaliea mediterranea]MBN7795600.1 TonB-dependent receptor [Parahaliea mediterranea]